MRKSMIAALVAIFVCSCISVAFGQDDQRATRRPDRQELRKRMLERFDKDGDGKLSPAERQAMIQTLRQGRQGRGDGQQRPDTYYKEYETRVERHIYKKTPQGELAIYIHFPKDWTAKDKRPAIVFFFGGAWTSGSIEQFTGQAHYLASRGMVTARADYRVRSRHQTTPDKCVEDAKSAVRWVRKNAAKFGVNPDKIVASGGSAGGHIAACTFTSRGLNAEGEDTKISAQPNLLVLYNPVLNCSNERIAQRMSSLEMAKRISPNLHLSRDTPPAIIFYGSKDRFSTQGEEFLKLSKQLGNTVELYMAEGQPHGFFNRSPWHRRTTFLVDQFLTKHGYLKGKPTLKLPEGDISLTNIAAKKKEDESNPKKRTTDQSVKAGQLAPDFKLPLLEIQTTGDGQNIGKIGSELISLSSFRGKMPVCLIFSSYT